jgi:hypothetical protein
MTVRVGDVTFSDWVSLEYEDGWTDTFIFRINALNGLPPFGYRPLLQRLVAHLNLKRRGASLWIQVDAPGDWYLAEVKRAILPGLSLPYVVTRVGDVPDYRSFSYRPRLFYSSLHRPPAVEDGFSDVSQEELRCLQVLGRIVKGDEDEIASLAGIPEKETYKLLDILKNKEFVEHKISPKIQKEKSKPVQMDDAPLWHAVRDGLSIALRSWGVPNRMAFNSRKEGNLHQIGTPHRNTSRRWPAWLRSAWPQAEIWAGWSEVRLPEISVLPDGLAWGRIQGYESLFWLEVGDEHKSRKQIKEITKKRLDEAWEFCQVTGVRLVYTQLSVDWVQEAARWAFVNLPKEVAVVMGNKRKFWGLPNLEWGRLVINGAE